jgi:hypothetical protein
MAGLQADIANSRSLADPRLGPIPRAAITKNGDGICRRCHYQRRTRAPGLPNSRSANCIDHLKELNYKVNILETDYANWERSVGNHRLMKPPFYKFLTIELLFCNNDDMALGAIDFLKRIG